MQFLGKMHGLDWGLGDHGGRQGNWRKQGGVKPCRHLCCRMASMGKVYCGLNSSVCYERRRLGFRHWRGGGGGGRSERNVFNRIGEISDLSTLILDDHGGVSHWGLDTGGNGFGFSSRSGGRGSGRRAAHRCDVILLTLLVLFRGFVLGLGLLQGRHERR